jgi:CheY-like chemotaxis protein
MAPFEIRQKPDKNKVFIGQKIVLVDDNPVIRRLYTRLFQKAGYIIFTASNGEEGLRLILAEKPNAAVIDFHLPDITGIQVCEQIRQSEELKDIKLFLFTGDDEEQTREKALNIGVDNVVVKSPDAAEIVDSVRRSLEKYKNL